jgi:anti-sigma factor RsiW
MMELHSSTDPWSDRLSEYIDEELSSRDRAALEAHLSGCASCRADLAALRRVAAHASTLSDRGPARDLWPGIAARIGAARATAAAGQARRFSFTMPQLIAASLALMTLSGGMVWLARLGGPTTDFAPTSASGPAPVTPASFAETTYDAAVADLVRMLENNRSKLDPETVRVLEENLASIDRAIGQCRAALAADPANVYLNTYLAETLARKLSLLRRANGLADRSS